MFFKKKTTVTAAIAESNPSLADSDLEALSVDELIDRLVELKAEQVAIREEKLRVHAVYERKLIQWHAQQALARVGLEGIVLFPGPLRIEMKGQEGNE